jgi:hypothetical protein
VAITNDLKLVVPLKRSENGDVLIYGYHTPIDRPVFEANYRVISATKAAIFGNGLRYAADIGPRIAALTLVDEGTRDSALRGEFMSDGTIKDGGAKSLLAELKRLTLVLSPGPNGWENLPVDVAIQRGIIDEEDWRDGESSIVFFTCAFAMAPRQTRKGVASVLAGVTMAKITSLAPTEYCAGLLTSTTDDAIATRAASSVPS